MKHLICCVFVLFVVFSENSNGKPSKARQFSNLSFAIPGLNLLQGANLNNNANYNNRVTNTNQNTNNNNNLGNNLLGGGNNFFRQATVTRTIVRTVSTVTQAAYRTCTASVPAALMPCAGRKKREATEDNLIEQVSGTEINPEPTMLVIFDSTTISDQKIVSSILNLDVAQDEPVPTTDNINSALLDEAVDPTTILYPSDEPSGIIYQDETPMNEKSDDQPNESDKSDLSVTETPILDDEITTSNPDAESEPNLGLNENARLGLGGTTTVTTTIGVTSVATTYASGSSATLTVMYTGCLPPSLPVTGTQCAP